MNGAFRLFNVNFEGCIWGYCGFRALFEPVRIKGFGCFEGFEYGLVGDGGASLVVNNIPNILDRLIKFLHLDQM